jgi:hypothetical protein
MAVPALHPSAERSLPAVRASRLAREIHGDQQDRYGDSLLEHVARVAARVPDDARPVALVHDVCERSPLCPVDVAFRAGLSDDERAALVLLTRLDDEDVLAHTRRVIAAPAGRPRDIAIAVKRADVGDHADRAPLDRSSLHARAAAVLAALPA